MPLRQKRTTSLTEGPIMKSLLALSIPIVLANVLQAAYQLTDAFWVGRLGGNALAAVSLSFPFTFLLISMGAGLGVAGSTLIAQHVGAKNETMVNHISAQTLLMVGVVSILLSILGYSIAPAVLHLMKVEPAVFVSALQFLRVSLIGIVFTFGFAMFQSVMRGVGEVKLPLYIVGGTVLLNFILDPVFIFGWGTIPAFGVAGAAWATFSTQSLAMILGFIVLFGGKYGIHLKWKDFVPDVSFIKKAFFLGLPASLEQSIRALGMNIMTFLVTGFGTLAIATYGVGFNVLTFIFIPAMGLSMATATLVGQNIGAGNIERADKIAKLSGWLSFLGLTFIGLLVFVFARPLVHFFVPNDTAVIESGVHYIRIMALFFGFIGLQQSLLGVFRAAGAMMVSLVLALVAQWVFQFPLAYILSRHTSLGVNGLWWAFPVANVITTIMALFIFMKGGWKKIRLTVDEVFAEKVSEEIVIEEGVKSM